MHCNCILRFTDAPGPAPREARRVTLQNSEIRPQRSKRMIDDTFASAIGSFRAESMSLNGESVNGRHKTSSPLCRRMSSDHSTPLVPNRSDVVKQCSDSGRWTNPETRLQHSKRGVYSCRLPGIQLSRYFGEHISPLFMTTTYEWANCTSASSCTGIGW